MFTSNIEEFLRGFERREELTEDDLAQICCENDFNTSNNRIDQLFDEIDREKEEKTFNFQINEIRNHIEFLLYQMNIGHNFKDSKYSSRKLSNFLKGKNYEILFMLLNRNGAILKYLNRKSRNNPEIVLAAVKNYGLALQYASKELKNNPEIVLAAVSDHGAALKHASNKLKNDEELVLAALKRNGRALMYASKKLRNNPKIVLAALIQDVEALQFASEELQNDPAKIKITKLKSTI